MPKRIVIVGAGIKGSILAALLSIAGAEIVLIDRDLIGSGTTSTNHGRLHLGTSSWRSDPDSLIQRRLKAAALMRSLPGVISAPKDAMYFFETQAAFGGQASTAFLDALEITHVMHDRGWINSIGQSGLIRTVLSQLPPDPAPGTSPMIWNRLGS